MNYFDDPNSKHFSFQSFAEDLDENTFGVINFKGYEAISKPYDFEIMLVSSKKDIELEDLLQAQAVFTIHRGGDDDVLYNGILAEFDQLHEVNDVIFYRARLVPKLWWLTLTHHNQVFLDQSIPDIVEDALRDGGLETADLDVGALSGYEENSYVCQYDESHFNFVSRCLERQGIYYYFAQEDDGEVLTLTDTKFSHAALKEGADLFYNPASGLEGKHLGEAIGSFTCRQKQLPAEIILKDYNYERPSLDITSRADVDPVGRGVSYLYGEYFATAEEGERLAGIRAEELLCKKQEFFGESTVPYVMPGFTFNLNNHYREDFNQEYLILEVTHEGNQSHLMSGGITSDSGKSLNQGIYHNSFKAIPNETQYRPDRITEKPKISGTIHAKIDSEVDGEYAQIDEQGRYRVHLPFDINDEHMDGKGSAPVRMMQSYAGKNRGMQFPLVKGTEVLLTFIEGNPDRPVIAGAVSNPETQGPVNADNQSESVIQTGGNNKIRMEDKAGSERIVLDSPTANSWIRVGAYNDPITLNGEATIYVEQGDSSWSDPGAVATSNEALTSFDWNSATWFSTDLDQSQVTPVRTNLDGTLTYNTDAEIVAASPGIYKYTYTDGNDTAIRTVVVYEAGEEIHSSVIPDASGIRIRSAGDLWLEGQSRYGDYHVGRPAVAPGKQASSSGPNLIGDLIGNFGADYNPTGLLDFNDHGSKSAWDGDTVTTDAKTVSETISNAHVRVSSLDTFNTQEGNIYDFGGYWNYNLGNSFAEEHIDQSARLNKMHDVMWYQGDAYFGHNPATRIAVGVTIATVTGALVTTVAIVQGGPSGVVAAGMVAGAVTLVGAAIGVGVHLGSHKINENIGDVIGGPESPSTNGTIKTWAFDETGFHPGGIKYNKGVGSSFKNVDKSTGKPSTSKRLQTDTPKDDTDAPMHTDTTWVTKQFGDAYTYNRGNDISIRVGNTEEHHHGDSYEYRYAGNHEEFKYNGKGTKVHWEQAGEGTKQEARWDGMGGSLLSYEYSNHGKFKYEASFVSIPTLKISTSTSTLQGEISVSAGATKIGVDISAGIQMDLNLVAGMFVKFERKVGGEVTWNEITGKAEFKAFGLKAAKEEAMKARKQEMIMDKLTTKLSKAEVIMLNYALKVEKNEMGVKMGQSFYL